MKEIQPEFLIDKQPSFTTKRLKHTQLYDLFKLEKYKILACLPPKAGTTNWQRYFAALEISNREPESFNIPEIFSVIPRVLSTYKEKTRNLTDFGTTEDLLNNFINYTRVINVRHPLARLLSVRDLTYPFNYKILKFSSFYSLATKILKRFLGA